jgi:restriction system protein
MPIPDYQSLMLPLLKIAKDGREHNVHDAIAALAHQFGITEEEQKQLLPSGLDRVFHNRVLWARTYLKKAGLIDYSKRSCFVITERGKKVLAENPPEITAKYLRRFPEFVEFVTPKKDGEQPEVEESDKTPQELIEVGYQKLRGDLEADLLAKVKACSPEFLEKMVVTLLLRMGYGGSLSDAGQAIGKSGDGGVDGVIKEDKLGLDLLYIQAKKWEGTPVGSPEIQKFVGALHGKKAKKGIFITNFDLLEGRTGVCRQH